MNWYDGINVVLWNRMGVHNYKASLICGSLLGSTGKILTIPTWDELGVIYFCRTHVEKVTCKCLETVGLWCICDHSSGNQTWLAGKSPN